MSRILPRVFVGSSREAEVYAKALCRVLSDVAEMVPWREAQEFRPMENILPALSEAAFNYDFGFFILAPDDVTVSRGRKTHSTRDNVLFEFGLFLGKLGPQRVTGLIQKSRVKSKSVKVPSDLDGVILPEFPAPPTRRPAKSVKGRVVLRTGKKIGGKVLLKDAEELVKGAANKLRMIIEKQGPNADMDLLGSYGYREKEKTFGMQLKAEKITRYLGKLRGKQFLVVARKQYDGVIAEHDTEIVKSKLYPVPNHIPQDIPIDVKCAKVFKTVRPGDMTEGYLLLVPPDLDVRGAQTLEELFEQGCLQIRKRGYEVQGDS